MANSQKFNSYEEFLNSSFFKNNCGYVEHTHDLPLEEGETYDVVGQFYRGEEKVDVACPRSVLLSVPVTAHAW